MSIPRIWVSAALLLVLWAGALATADQFDNSAELLETSAEQPDTSAEELETSAEQLKTSAEELETSAEQPETSADQLETSAEELETSAEPPKTSADQPETSAEQLETTADQPDTSADQLETSAELLEGSGDSCGCEAITDRMAQMEASISERLDASEEQNSQQSEQICELRGEMKNNGESASQLSEQVAKLAAQMENDDNVKRLKKKVGKLADDLDDTNTKTAALTQQVEDLAAQLSEMSERLGSSEGTAAEPTRTWPPRDCSSLVEPEEGVQLLYLGTGADAEPVKAYCELDPAGGAWTVIQRRDNITPRENFHRRWRNYKNGFGDLMGEFWWGLEHLFDLTSRPDCQYQLQVDLVNWEGERRHALYDSFRVSSESDGYRLTVSGYSGDAGDSLSAHSGQQFSTRDRDLDQWPWDSCARTHRGGWWYTDCGPASLNGRYVSPGRGHRAGSLGWDGSDGSDNSLRTVTMKVRPAPQTAE